MLGPPVPYPQKNKNKKHATHVRLGLVRYTLVGGSNRYDIFFGTRSDAFQLYRDDPMMLVNECQLGKSWRSVADLCKYCDRIVIRRMGDIYQPLKVGMYPWDEHASITVQLLADARKKSDIQTWVGISEELQDFLLSAMRDDFATLACDLARATAMLKVRFPAKRKSFLGLVECNLAQRSQLDNCNLAQRLQFGNCDSEQRVQLGKGFVFCNTWGLQGRVGSRMRQRAQAYDISLKGILFVCASGPAL